MKYLWVILAVCFVLGCGSQDSLFYPVGTPTGRPLEVKIVNSPSINEGIVLEWDKRLKLDDPNKTLAAEVEKLKARIKALEARVENLEDWATQRGGRFK